MVPAHSTRMSSRQAAISHRSAISGSNSGRWARRSASPWSRAERVWIRFDMPEFIEPTFEPTDALLIFGDHKRPGIRPGLGWSG
jgi:hypothetical protein